MIDVEEQVIDVTDHFHCLKAEQRGKDVLILRRLDRLCQRADGCRVRFEIEYRWLTNPADLRTVLGNEFTYWGYRDVAGYKAKGLFAMFRLFP